jgi:hypothetical protein
MQSLYVPGPFDNNGNSLFNAKIRDMNKTGGDTNTGLRQLQEQLQKYINENSTK